MSHAESQRRYNQTAKGKAATSRYKQSGKGQAAIARARAAHGRKNKAREKRKIRQIIESIKSRPCADCKQTFDPVCMDFDHRPGEVKLFCVGAIKYSTRLVLEEIAKCDVVCACCHRLRTYRLRDHAATRNHGKSDHPAQLELLPAEREP